MSVLWGRLLRYCLPILAVKFAPLSKVWRLLAMRKGVDETRINVQRMYLRWGLVQQQQAVKKSIQNTDILIWKLPSVGRTIL